MTTFGRREIVIEFEKVQMIRKRATTIYTFCRSCGGEKDFVDVRAAAKLFGITIDELRRFVTVNAVHIAATGTSGNGICIASLLNVMQAMRNTKLISNGENPAVS